MAQRSGCRRPHRGQKAKFTDNSKPQPTQVIEGPSSRANDGYHSTCVQRGHAPDSASWPIVRSVDVAEEKRLAPGFKVSGTKMG